MMGARAAALLVLMAGCGDDAGDRDAGRDAAEADAAGEDGGTGPAPAWHEAHCRDRDCYYVMSGAAGASDTECNGRHPRDLGTVDADGKRDCPFATLGATSPVRSILAGGDEGSLRVTVFIGGGRYPLFPGGLAVFGRGTGPDDAVIVTSLAGQAVTLDGACPATCTIETPAGPRTLDPCCGLVCTACDADPRCVPSPFEVGECVVPWDKIEIPLTVGGQWVRIEGIEIDGCAEDALRVVYRTSRELRAIPNDRIFIANNRIGGCDINENIKSISNGPGQLQGGPTWGPVHIIGNELHAMASQAVDATGPHNWLIEESYVHDAKEGGIPGVITYDGGGIGPKNGASLFRVRNNWLVRGGGIGSGGVSGSCIRQTEPPADWGCFQTYEMTDMLVENNVILDAATDGYRIYQCDGCRFFGNFISGIGGVATFFIEDDCPGPRCPAFNPGLLASRNMRLERNYLYPGPVEREGSFLAIYSRDVHPDGPAGHGMTSRSNIFCAPDGDPVVADPASELERFGHDEPPMLYAFDAFASQIGDDGSSAVFNAPGAAMTPCPVAPPACTTGIEGGMALWEGPPGCAGCTCRVAWDDAEMEAECSGSMPIPTAAAAPGRHYFAVRVDRARGGTSCGASYQIASPVVGAGCEIAVAGDAIRWRSDGLRCRLLADGGMDVGPVDCTGSLSLPASLATTGRHHVRLQLLEAPDGQTTCGVMFTR